MSEQDLILEIREAFAKMAGTQGLNGPIERVIEFLAPDMALDRITNRGGK